MGGRTTRSSSSLLLLPLALIAAVVLSACSTAAGDENIAVPTFPTADPGRPAAGAAPIEIKLPDDCSRLMTAENAGALFAQPIGGVAVQTVRGVPEPSVKRTERVACTYRATGQSAPGQGAPGQSTNGPVLYQLNIGRYTDAAAAGSQWRSNTNAERSDSTGSRDLAVGDAKGVLVQRPDETTLSLVYGVDTLTFVLPASAPGQTRPATETLPDLAQRVIPSLAPTQPPGSRPAAGPAPAPPTATPPSP